MAVVHFYFWYPITKKYNPSYLSFLLLMHIWVVSSLENYQIMLLWTFFCMVNICRHFYFMSIHIFIYLRLFTFLFPWTMGSCLLPIFLLCVCFGFFNLFVCLFCYVLLRRYFSPNWSIDLYNHNKVSQQMSGGHWLFDFKISIEVQMAKNSQDNLKEE